MLIAILGPPASGKRTLAKHLTKTHSYITCHIDPTCSELTPSSTDVTSTSLTFRDSNALLNHATKQWRRNFVTVDLRQRVKLEEFAKRPFVVVVDVQAPLGVRWRRAVAVAQAEGRRPPTLEEFVEEDDLLMHGASLNHPADTRLRKSTPLQHTASGSLLLPTAADEQSNSHNSTSSVSTSATSATTAAVPVSTVLSLPSLAAEPLAPLLSLSTFTFLNPHSTPEPFLSQLSLPELAITLRPAWDVYFMLLAVLASLRSNCMKRRVGAVLVRERRVVSTGYNGTPRGVVNCGEGGCSRCNMDGDGLGGGLGGEGKGMGEGLDECVCLHAEENALLEAGRERVSGGGVEGAVLYCNTCPCLRCTVKIVQCGVREVVYSLSYSMDVASKRVFDQAGVVIRQIPLPPFPV